MLAESFEKTFAAIRDLSLKPGPNRNILEPKFQAREQMEALRDAVVASFKKEPSLLAQCQLARIFGFLGHNYIECEEEKDGFAFLYKSHRLILGCIAGRPEEEMPPAEGTPLTGILTAPTCAISATTGYDYVSEYMAIMNTLGLHMSATESPQRMNDAIKILHFAEECYKQWNENFISTGGPKLEDLKLLDNGTLDREATDKEALPKHQLRLTMDALYTSTLFFLAQAYTHSDLNRASMYCHLTMLYQLQTKCEFDHKTWAENALHLSGYYAGLRDYGRALHCLEAGRYMMPKMPDDEETTGRVVWGFGRYHLSRLRHYAAVRGGDAPAADRLGWWVSFPLPIPPPTPQPAIVTFEQARAEFKLGNAQLKKAAEYYKFDEQCTDHIQILQDISALYKNLIEFEPDLDRQVAMHKRRLALFETIPLELSPQAYLTLIRQLEFDNGDIAMDILDLRIRQRRAENHSLGKPFTEKTINTLQENACLWYDRFLATFENPVGRQADEVAVAVFRCLMRRASLVTKRFFKEPKEEYDAIGEAIEEYGRVLKFIENNKLGPEMADEIELAKQMHALLPGKQRNIMAFNRPR